MLASWVRVQIPHRSFPDPLQIRAWPLTIHTPKKAYPQPIQVAVRTKKYAVRVD
jgi:hypothetical protein